MVYGITPFIHFLKSALVTARTCRKKQTKYMGESLLAPRPCCTIPLKIYKMDHLSDILPPTGAFLKFCCSISCVASVARTNAATWILDSQFEKFIQRYFWNYWTLAKEKVIFEWWRSRRHLASKLNAVIAWDCPKCTFFSTDRCLCWDTVPCPVHGKCWAIHNKTVAPIGNISALWGWTLCSGRYTKKAI